MRRIGRRNTIPVVIVLILVGGILIVPALLGIGSVPEDDGLWFRTGPYQWHENETYCVMFHGVNFTFLYYHNHGFLDVPYPIFVGVEFPDGTTENLSIGVGGWMIIERVNFTEHTSPRAAVFNFDSTNHELHYSWFYAVEVS